MYTDWIKVTERLPEINKPVLATFRIDKETSFIFVAWYSPEANNANDDGWVCTDLCINDSDQVVAWMPLPEPFKE